MSDNSETKVTSVMEVTVRVKITHPESLSSRKAVELIRDEMDYSFSHDDQELGITITDTELVDAEWVG